MKRGERARRVPMRLWLGASFALVSLITAASVYVFVDDSSGRTLQSESADLAAGKTSSLADDLGKVDKLHAANVLAQSNSETFSAWAVNRHGNPFAPGQDLNALATVQQKGDAIRAALANRSYRASLPRSEERRVGKECCARCPTPHFTAFIPYVSR